MFCLFIEGYTNILNLNCHARVLKLRVQTTHNRYTYNVLYTSVVLFDLSITTNDVIHILSF